jgi:hypothetical protein
MAKKVTVLKLTKKQIKKSWKLIDQLLSSGMTLRVETI